MDCKTMTEFLLGCLVGQITCAAIVFGTEARFERRAALRSTNSAFAKFLLHRGLAFANLGLAKTEPGESK